VKAIDEAVTTPFNPTGQTVLALCCGFLPDSFPTGMQIAGRPFGDAGVLAAGHAFEEATDFRSWRPVILPSTVAA
jgi:aspartyl-tRNA(Asn)/glutamyl-tRNA(Gln) amidotransferase subunit A